MVDPAEGVKGTPGTPPGTGEGDDLAAADGVMFEDDQITEQDGQKLVPLDVALAERKKRQSLEAELLEAKKPKDPEPDVEPAGQPSIDWDKLMGEPDQDEGGKRAAVAQPDGWTKERYDEFNTNFKAQLDDNPWQAVMYAISQGIAGNEAQKNQARKFVPDMDKLALHNVSDTEIQMLMQNPHALKALIAKSKTGDLGGGSVADIIPPDKVPIKQPLTEKEIWIAEGRKQERDFIKGVGKQPGQGGDPGAGSGEPEPGTEETWELDKPAIDYFKTRGYTDEQIAKMAPKIVAERRRKGLM